jgi:hypothetical protein
MQTLQSTPTRPPAGRAVRAALPHTSPPLGAPPSETAPGARRLSSSCAPRGVQANAARLPHARAPHLSVQAQWQVGGAICYPGCDDRAPRDAGAATHVAEGSAAPRRACGCRSLSVSAAALPSDAEGAVAGASRSAASRRRLRRRRRSGGPARSPGAAWISACASPRPSAPPPPPPGGAAGASAWRTRESMMPLGENTYDSGSSAPGAPVATAGSGTAIDPRCAVGDPPACAPARAGTTSAGSSGQGPHKPAAGARLA